jgi:hypothetical protein
MSLLDTASLIVTPNGYKEGKLYSVIPSDGSGDLSVTRATTATRVNSAGLVELVPYNLLQYSEDISNSVWTKNAVSVTSSLAPDGSSTAYKLTPNTSNTLHYIYQTNSRSVGNYYTLEIYAKADGYDTCRIATNGNDFGDVNLTSLSISLSNATGSVTDVGNGWRRILITSTSDLSTEDIYIIVGTASFAGNGTSGVLFWHTQLVEGSTAKDYQKTETRLNIPRLDYSNGTCPSLLVEPQRTNLALYSSSFDSSTWSKNELTVGTNAFFSPSGIQDADKIIPNTVNTFHTVQQVLSVSSGATYSFSIYAKASGYNYVVFNTGGSTAGNSGPIVNLSNGTIAGFFGSTDYNAQVEDVGNGWYRISFAFTTNSTSASVDINIFPTATVASYAGNGTSGCLFWGYQFEAGSYATSYIPTTSASVTRNLDILTKTSATALIGQTEGTLFVDAYITGKDSSNGSILFATDKASSGALIRIIYTSTNALRFDVFNGSSFECLISAGAYNVGDRVKVAGGYKNNDFVMYVNGTQIGTDTSGSVPATDKVNINTSIYGDTNGSFVNAAALWTTRLTNTQLAQLTTI